MNGMHGCCKNVNKAEILGKIEKIKIKINYFGIDIPFRNDLQSAIICDATINKYEIANAICNLFFNLNTKV